MRVQPVDGLPAPQSGRTGPVARGEEKKSQSREAPIGAAHEIHHPLNPRALYPQFAVHACRAAQFASAGPSNTVRRQHGHRADLERSGPSRPPPRGKIARRQSPRHRPRTRLIRLLIRARQVGRSRTNWYGSHPSILAEGRRGAPGRQPALVPGFVGVDNVQRGSKFSACKIQ